MQHLTDSMKTLLMEAARTLKGSARRVFMARTVKELGYGGQRYVEREFGWDRGVIRKGMGELAHGTPIADHFSNRGRKPAEEHLPQLLEDICAIVDPRSHADPHVRCDRVYTRITAAEVRRQLLQRPGYTDDTVPTAETIGKKMNQLGYTTTRVAKSIPKKKIPATEAIFRQVDAINADADQREDTLRISIDAKATVTLGPFARGGTNRTGHAACDHDFTTHERITPFGIFLPRFAELFLYMVCSRVTSDCIVDILLRWWNSVGDRYPHIRYLVINLDNGPENNSHRTQFMARMVRFAQETGLCITLAYYPPYHSKYNPIERCWGVLEKHWNGDILDTNETVIQFAKTMTWKGKHPICVERISTVYENGVRLTKSAMQQIETQIERLSELKRWFVTIPANTVSSSFGRF